MPMVRLLVTLQGLLRSLSALQPLVTLLVSILGILIMAIYYQRRRVYRRLTASGLPTIYWRPKFITFNPSSAHDSTNKLPSSNITNILPRMQRLKGPYDMYGTVYGWSTPVIHVAHPVPARAVLSITSFIDNSDAKRTLLDSCGATKAPAYDHFKNFCGEGVFTADGKDWKTKRAAVMHALLRVDGGYEAAVEREALRALQALDDDLDRSIGKQVDVVPLLQRATIGLIYRYITHTDLDTRLSGDHGQMEDASAGSTSGTSSMISKYLESITRIRLIILAQSRSVWFLLPRWCYRQFSTLFQEEEETMKPIRLFSSLACEKARCGSPLAMLKENPIYMQPKSTAISKNLLDEAVTLLFAGQDTSAATLSWTLHLLSLYPHVQNKLFEEIHVAFEGESGALISWKRVSRLSYLDAVIKESMRLYPVAPFVVRRLPYDLCVREEDQIDVTLPAQSIVCIWIYSMHRHPQFWSNPDDFIPERWLCNREDGTRDEGLTNGAFIPFATGPRNCVGQPLAQIVLRIFLAHLIYNYKFVDNGLDDGMPPSKLRKDMQAGFTVLPQNGLHLSLKTRCRN